MIDLKYLLALLVAVSGTSAWAQSPEPIGDGITVFRDLDFATNPSGTLQLDLYVPIGGTEPVPGIVVIPGGGFRPQTKDKFAAEARRLAGAGFAAASIGYRGAPEDSYLATIADTKAAVRFMRANATQYGIDPDRIGAFGQSAGGHLAVMLAVSGGEADLEGDGGNPGISSAVQAAVSFAGGFDFISRLKDGGQQARNFDAKRKSNGAWIGEAFSENSLRWKQASPYFHADSSDSPVLFVHCKDDSTVPYLQSVKMYDKMKTWHGGCRLVLFEEGGHNIRTSPRNMDKAWAETIAFFRENLSRSAPGKKDVGPPPSHADVHYGPYARNRMDVWTAAGPNPAPVLVSIHGGGFRKGDKRVAPDLLRAALASGIAVVAITYRFTDEAIAPAQFYDAARAIQFIRHNAPAWNIDPARIAATGGSAGAGLSLWLGFHNDMADPDSADPVLRQSTRLTCMAVKNAQSSYDPRFIRSLFPGTDTYRAKPQALLFDIDIDQLDALPEEKYRLMEELAPINHVTVDDPPVLLVYESERDAPIVSESIGIHHPRFGYALKEKMDAAGVACEVLPGMDGKEEPQTRAVMDFLRKNLGISDPAPE